MKGFGTLVFITFFLLQSTAQQTKEDSPAYQKTMYILYPAEVDSLHLNWIDNDKSNRKLSQSERDSLKNMHIDEVNEFNANQEALANNWKDDSTILFLMGAENKRAMEYYTQLMERKQLKEGETFSLKSHSIIYSSRELFMRGTGAYPLFSHLRPASFLLNVHANGEELPEIQSAVMTETGVLSEAQLTLYIKAVIAQHKDFNRGVTWENQEVFYNRMKDLKEMTLLIPENSVSSRLTMEKIKEAYPYNIEVLSSDEIDNRILSDDGAKYAVYTCFLRTAHSMKENANWGLDRRDDIPVDWIDSNDDILIYEAAIYNAQTGERMDAQDGKLLGSQSLKGPLTNNQLNLILDQIQRK
ncbi:MAG: hypothetical protein NXI10_04265 [bacterium]|nr:hypothetical protein [bacterium]